MYKKLNVYDFDGTIYDGDSTVDFFLFALKHNWKIIFCLPEIFIFAILYALRIVSLKQFKSHFFCFVRKLKDMDKIVKEFWKKNEKKIQTFFLENIKTQKNIYVISASPEFLLKPYFKKYKKVKLIATDVSEQTGEFISENCKGNEKINRLNKQVDKYEIENFYSDSLHDLPLAKVSHNSYMVSHGKVTEWDKETLKEPTKQGIFYRKLDKLLLICILLYLVIPIMMQLFYWVNRTISIPLIVMLIIGLILVIRRIKPLSEEQYKKIFQKKKIILFIILILILNLLSGAGGLFFQNWDYHGRNAIFHDLIDHSWPVTYNYQGLPYENAIFGNTGILDYYFAFWLPGAWIGKIAGFKIASIFMLLYQTIGVILFFYLVCRFMKNIKYRCFFIFLAFGGLDVIINVIVSVMNHVPIQPFGMKHIDTSSAPFCMSTFVTQLFWVFNQSLPTWLAVMYFLQQKDFKTCGYLFALVVPYGPFPMMGFLYLIFCYIIFGKKLNKLLNWKRFKSLLTVPNFFGVIAILPIAFMYTLNKSQKGLVFMRASHNGTLNTTLLLYLIFFILEFFVYIIIINKKNWKELLVCFAFFAIAPLFYVGGFDLGNRSTIPLLILLYILIVQFLDKLDRRQVNIYWRQILCIVILCIAFATNFNEIHRAIYNTYFDYKYHYSNITDKYKTFDEFEGKEVAPFITNFVVPYQEDNKILTLLYRENPVLKEEEIVSKENEKLKTYHNWVNVSKYNVTTKTIDTIRFKMNGVVRGKKAAKIVKESLINDEKALYEYQTPKKGYEWVVFKYDLDLDGFQLGEYGTSASIEFKVFLKNQSSSLETINLNPSDLVMDTKLSGMYAVQLPIGENDYFISVGNTKGNYVLFQDEKK